MGISSNDRLCKKCGAELLSAAHGSLCSACLLEVALDPLESPADLSLSQTVVAEKQPRKEEPADRISLRSFGDYELLAEIARGGQGVVFRARQKSLNRIVALKMIALGSWAMPSHLKRFQTEAEAAANLDHPQIVPIYEIGEVDGQHYFTMKFIEGISLKDLTRKGPLPSRRAVEIMAGVARAIDYAHEHGILHRDIKPGNILLDAQNHAYVTDFGLAKLVEDESTVTNTMDVLGTPSYMAPEQAAGHSKNLTRTADVYGLGAVFYELLTANPPFAGGTTLETIRQVLEKEPRRPTLWNNKVDRDLETICLKCLEKQADRRYPTAAALAEDLERWLRHEPIQARPSTFLYRGSKWARRNPATVVSLVAVLALAGAIGMVIRQSLGPKLASQEGPHLAILCRAADTNSTSAAKTCSRELIGFCSRLSGLKTVSRTEILQWETSDKPIAKIGRALHADAILVAQVRQLGELIETRLELTACRPASAQRLWIQSLTNSTADWDATRSQIIRAVVTHLKITTTGADQELLQRPKSKSAAALTEYYRGCREVDALDEISSQKAIDHFKAAVAADGRFAQAHAMLGYAYLNVGYNFRDPAEYFSKAQASVETALAIDAQLPEAKIADGLIKYFYEWKWDEASRALDEAMRLDLSALEANPCYLHMRDVYGEGEEALKKVHRAVDMNPRSPALQEELGCAAYYAGLFDQAVSNSQESVRDDPENPATYWQLARALAQKHEYEKARSVLGLGKAKSMSSLYPALDAEIAYISAKQGRTNEARQIIASLHTRLATGFIDPYLFAMIFAGLGDTDQLFASLNASCDKHSSWMPSFPVEPKFIPFREDPRYQQLLTRMKIPGPRSH